MAFLTEINPWFLLAVFVSFIGILVFWIRQYYTRDLHQKINQQQTKMGELINQLAQAKVTLKTLQESTNNQEQQILGMNQANASHLKKLVGSQQQCKTLQASLDGVEQTNQTLSHKLENIEHCHQKLLDQKNQEISFLQHDNDSFNAKLKFLHSAEKRIKDERDYYRTEFFRLGGTDINGDLDNSAEAESLLEKSEPIIKLA